MGDAGIGCRVGGCAEVAAVTRAVVKIEMIGTNDVIGMATVNLDYIAGIKQEDGCYWLLLGNLSRWERITEASYSLLTTVLPLG